MTLLWMFSVILKELINFDFYLHLLNRYICYLYFYKISLLSNVISLFENMFIHIGEKLYIHTRDEKVW